MSTLALEVAIATLANRTEPLPVPVPVAVDPLAPHGAPDVVPKVPVRGGTGPASNVKVAHAAPRAVVPRARVELVAWPCISHWHFNAYPGSKFTLNFADVPRKGTEARTLGRDDAWNPHLERRTTWCTFRC
jgi:hypothetical protein